ncbi:MAG: nitrite/sulfite reductase [bacterium]
MQTIVRLPEDLEQDLVRFREEVERFKLGILSPDDFRAMRVPMGIYEQRQNGTYMLRVRLTGGCMLPHQMRALASVSRKYGNGVLHVTTRQDIQIHQVLFNNLCPAIEELHQVQLSTKGGGGNTVRNITVCQDSGVCPRAFFDTTSYAIALTEQMLRDPRSFRLPRKFKINFGGCSDACSGATVADIGFVAKDRKGSLGFSVYVGGGMGARSRVADLLEEFIPSSEVYLVAEAIKRVFDKCGNREDRNQARLRFLLEKIGLDAFRKLYRAEFDDLKSQNLPPLQLRPMPRRRPAISEFEGAPDRKFYAWRRVNVLEQNQKGYFLVRIPLHLGDIAADKLTTLSKIADRHGEGMIRATQRQSLTLRWVPEQDLPSVHQGLHALGLAKPTPRMMREIIACAGATTCRLGFCNSRGLAAAISKQIEASDLPLDEFDPVTIYISGCSNSCSRHPIARIGLMGSARRVGDHLAPYYIASLGGVLHERRTRFAQGKIPLPARNIPRFVEDFLRLFRASANFPDFDAFLATDGKLILAELADKHGHLPSFDDDPSYYTDWGATELFSIEGRGSGECSAGR